MSGRSKSLIGTPRIIPSSRSGSGIKGAGNSMTGTVHKSLSIKKAAESIQKATKAAEYLDKAKGNLDGSIKNNGTQAEGLKQIVEEAQKISKSASKRAMKLSGQTPIKPGMNSFSKGKRKPAAGTPTKQQIKQMNKVIESMMKKGSESRKTSSGNPGTPGTTGTPKQINAELAKQQAKLKTKHRAQGTQRQKSKNVREIVRNPKKQKGKKKQKHTVHFTKYGIPYVYRFSKLTGKRYKSYLK